MWVSAPMGFMGPKQALKIFSTSTNTLLLLRKLSPICSSTWRSENYFNSRFSAHLLVPIPSLGRIPTLHHGVQPHPPSMGSENIWRHAKSVFSRQRYHGVPSDRTEKTSPEWSNQIEGQENIEGNTKPEAIVRESSSPQKPHWINGVLLCAKATTALLLLNIIFIAVAAGLSNRNAENSAFSSFQVMYKGSCLLSKRWNIALHLIINVLSTGILGASNYCMQSLVAPSREEVDKYHARGWWLDIGCSSVRNLFVIGRSRLALWLVLLVTATPFHLLYVVGIGLGD